MKNTILISMLILGGLWRGIISVAGAETYTGIVRAGQLMSEIRSVKAIPGKQVKCSDCARLENPAWYQVRILPYLRLNGDRGAWHCRIKSIRMKGKYGVIGFVGFTERELRPKWRSFPFELNMYSGTWSGWSDFGYEALVIKSREFKEKLYVHEVKVDIDNSNCPVPPNELEVFSWEIFMGNKGRSVAWIMLDSEAGTGIIPLVGEQKCTTTLDINLPAEIVLSPAEKRVLMTYNSAKSSCAFTYANRNFHARISWDNSKLDGMLVWKIDGVVVKNGVTYDLAHSTSDIVITAPATVPVGQSLLGNLNVEVIWP